jgi:hypothetical protein
MLTRHRSELTTPILANPPDREWLERASEHTRGKGSHPELKEILIEIGGWAAVIPRIESDLKRILARGRRFPGRSTTMKGEPSRCHSNSACCWDENRELCRICTGYALSKDGVWRQHSWIYTNKGAVVETTEKMVQYYGFVMTHDECEDFLFGNS